MRMKRWWLALSVSACLAGCAGYSESYSLAPAPAPVASPSQVVMKQSEFDASPTFFGRPMVASTPDGFPQRRWVQLVETGDRAQSNQKEVVLANFWYLGDWAYFTSANYEGGKFQRLDDVDRKVGDCHNGCDFTEKTMLFLPKEYLEHHAKTGFSLRYNTQRHGSVVVSIPAYEVQGFLDGVQAKLAKK